LAEAEFVSPDGAFVTVMPPAGGGDTAVVVFVLQETALMTRTMLVIASTKRVNFAIVRMELFIRSIVMFP
jgi:hypothetical protein